MGAIGTLLEHADRLFRAGLTGPQPPRAGRRHARRHRRRRCGRLLRPGHTTSTASRTGSRSRAGRHHLNGNQALAFARVRKAASQSELTRAARQQEVLSGIREAVKSGGFLRDPIGFMKAVGKTVLTNVPRDPHYRHRRTSPRRVGRNLDVSRSHHPATGSVRLRRARLDPAAQHRGGSGRLPRPCSRRPEPRLRRNTRCHRRQAVCRVPGSGPAGPRLPLIQPQGRQSSRPRPRAQRRRRRRRRNRSPASPPKPTATAAPTSTPTAAPTPTPEPTPAPTPVAQRELRVAAKTWGSAMEAVFLSTAGTIGARRLDSEQQGDAKMPPKTAKGEDSRRSVRGPINQRQASFTRPRLAPLGIEIHVSVPSVRPDRARVDSPFRELSGPEHHPRRLDDPLRALQEAPLAGRGADVLPAPPPLR